MNELSTKLLRPAKLLCRNEILSRDCPVPKKPGVYAWYFRQMPHGVPTTDCHKFDNLNLLYVGISPKAPPLNGASPSRQNLFHRIRYHMRGNAEGSTLRLTLGCLLSTELGIQLRRVGSGKRHTFSSGESNLSEWMGENAFVTWEECLEPWVDEELIIQGLSLPLNLQHNNHHPFYPELKIIRNNAKKSANNLPILPR